jgi:hypothetical protein
VLVLRVDMVGELVHVVAVDGRLIASEQQPRARATDKENAVQTEQR